MNILANTIDVFNKANQDKIDGESKANLNFIKINTFRLKQPIFK